MATKMQAIKGGKLTPDAFKALEAVHGPLREMKLNLTSKESAFFYLKKPPREVISFAYNMYKAGKHFESGELIYTNLCVSTDDRINESDPEVLASAYIMCNTHIDLRGGLVGEYSAPEVQLSANPEQTT